MTTRDRPWPAGSPCWADIVVADLDAARAFYGPVLGWEFEAGEPDVGGYLVATLEGHRVAGLTTPAVDDPAARPAWCVYLATSDATASAARAVELGATVLLPPTRILDRGTTVLLADPTGAVVGLWEPGANPGWTAVDEPGAPTWSEVFSHDQAASLAFYTGLFAYTVRDLSGGGLTYAVLDVGHHPAAGVGAYGAGAGDGAPSAWTLYLAVDDTDAATDRVRAHGGTVLQAPADTPYGRVAITAGPSGEVFALMRPQA